MVVQRLTLRIGDRGMAVAIVATKVQRKEVLAVGTVAAPAGIAVTAGAIGQHHMVAHLEVAHVRAHRLNDASPLMAEHCRQRHRVVLVAHDQVGMAQARRHHLHQYLVVLRATQPGLLDDEGLFFAADHGGGDLVSCGLVVHRDGSFDQIG